MAVIDASVYVSLVNSQEINHQSSLSWFQQALTSQQQIFAPSILIAEVAAALSRGMGNSNLALKVVDQLLQAKVIRLLPVTPNLATQAAMIAAQYQIRGCDAIYVAVAQHLNEELVTLDQQQFERGGAVVSTYKPLND